MKRRKDPPGYPGDEAVLKAIGDALRAIRLEKGLSLEEANALFVEAKHRDAHELVPRALGIVVRQLREKQKLSRLQLSRASGLPVRFIGNLERGRARDATVTDIVRLSFGLGCPVVEFVELIVGLEQKLKLKSE
jgi:transcriptional regulator with XRE-family HTH domain